MSNQNDPYAQYSKKLNSIYENINQIMSSAPRLSQLDKFILRAQSRIKEICDVECKQIQAEPGRFSAFRRYLGFPDESNSDARQVYVRKELNKLELQCINYMLSPHCEEDAPARVEDILDEISCKKEDVDDEAILDKELKNLQDLTDYASGKSKASEGLLKRFFSKIHTSFLKGPSNKELETILKEIKGQADHMAAYESQTIREAEQYASKREHEIYCFAKEYEENTQKLLPYLAKIKEELIYLCDPKSDAYNSMSEQEILERKDDLVEQARLIKNELSLTDKFDIRKHKNQTSRRVALLEHTSLRARTLKRASLLAIEQIKRAMKE